MVLYLKNSWISFLLLGLVVGLGWWLSPNLPERMPVHFNIHCQPDGYGSKALGMALLPMVNFLVILFVPLLVKFSPNSFQMVSTQKGLARVNLAMTICLCGFQALILLYSIRPEAVSLSLGFSCILASYMVLWGNYLSKIERNFFQGIRTPWTLASERNWSATHRFSARMWVALGFASLAITLFRSQFYWTLGFLLAAFVLSRVYSFYFYMMYEKKTAKK
jgi:uncharacterized membrane protein